MKYSRLVPLLEQENLKLKNDIELLNRHIQQQDAEIKRLEAKSASQTEIYEKLEFHSAESEFSLRKRIEELVAEKAELQAAYAREAGLRLLAVDENAELHKQMAAAMSIYEEEAEQVRKLCDEKQMLIEHQAQVNAEFAREAGLRLNAVCSNKKLKDENAKLKAVVQAARELTVFRPKTDLETALAALDKEDGE